METFDGELKITDLVSHGISEAQVMEMRDAATDTGRNPVDDFLFGQGPNGRWRHFYRVEGRGFVPMPASVGSRPARTTIDDASTLAGNLHFEFVAGCALLPKVVSEQ